MRLMAAGAAAVLTPSLERALAAPAAKAGAATKAPPHKPMTPAVRAELASQKKSLEDTLRVIREYKLPPGSPPAFAFRAERRDVRRGR
jgi:hypothetical protein